MMQRPLSILLAVTLLAATGCATTPPKQVDNACVIFEEKPDWYEATRDTEKRWGVPIQVQLAIIRQESTFKHDAKPPRETFLGIPLWWRKSSAYGYAQVKDKTWDWYRDKTGNSWADRDDFEDATDFIGWYSEVSRKQLGISKWDGYNQYLAYHEGHGGWKRKTYKKKAWLMKVARLVDRNTRAYGTQLKGCRVRLDSGSSWWWPF
jgi:hypothetical protein